MKNQYDSFSEIETADKKYLISEQNQQRKYTPPFMQYPSNYKYPISPRFQQQNKENEQTNSEFDDQHYLQALQKNIGSQQTKIYSEKLNLSRSEKIQKAVEGYTNRMNSFYSSKRKIYQKRSLTFPKNCFSNLSYSNSYDVKKCDQKIYLPEIENENCSPLKEDTDLKLNKREHGILPYSKQEGNKFQNQNQFQIFPQIISSSNIQNENQNQIQHQYSNSILSKNEYQMNQPENIQKQGIIQQINKKQNKQQIKEKIDNLRININKMFTNRKSHDHIDNSEQTGFQKICQTFQTDQSKLYENQKWLPNSNSQQFQQVKANKQNLSLYYNQKDLKAGGLNVKSKSVQYDDLNLQFRIQNLNKNSRLNTSNEYNCLQIEEPHDLYFPFSRRFSLKRLNEITSTQKSTIHQAVSPEQSPSKGCYRQVSYNRQKLKKILQQNFKVQDNHQSSMNEENEISAYQWIDQNKINDKKQILKGESICKSDSSFPSRSAQNATTSMCESVKDQNQFEKNYNFNESIQQSSINQYKQDFSQEILFLKKEIKNLQIKLEDTKFEQANQKNLKQIKRELKQKYKQQYKEKIKLYEQQMAIQFENKMLNLEKEYEKKMQDMCDQMKTTSDLKIQQIQNKFKEREYFIKSQLEGRINSLQNQIDSAYINK